MIYANVDLTIQDHKTVANKNIVLYRGDKNVEIRFVLKGNRFVVLENTYAQMIITRPSALSVFSRPVLIENNTVVFKITAEMIDELMEIGAYTFQIRLYDDNLVARATLPPCEGCLIINQPIAVESGALVNVAMVNNSAIMAVASDTPEEEIFTEDNAYNRTVWVDGDIISDSRMNKIENALYYINENSGGSSATSPYISTSLSETVMVSTGEDFELDLDFSSPNMGKGTLKIFINDVDVMSPKVDQGMTKTIIPGSLFAKGTNMVVIYVLDRVGVMSNSLTFYIRYGGTEVSSTFDAYISYDYGATIRYYFTPTALDTSLQLTFFMEIDGTVQNGVLCSSDVRSYYTFPTDLAVGNHHCKAWVVDGTTKSNVLEFNLIILDNTSLVVASDTLNPTVEEGTQLVLDYKVYMKNNTSFITKTYVDNVLVNTGTCTLETAYYRTTSLTEGTHTVKVEVWDVTETYSDYVTWTVTVTESTYTMLEPTSAGSVFMATAYNKSNVDENRDVWIGTNQDGENIVAELSNFSFNSENGWIDDALVISGNSWVEIPIAPLANNAQYGFTLDIEFSTKPIGVEDAEVLTLWNETDNCGIKITTEQLILRSKSGNQCDLYFGEDEIVSAIFVIDRDEKTAKIYLNGVMCEAFALSDYEAAGQRYLEDFTVESNVFLGGYNKNGYCAIKNVRIYEVALATNEILNNFMTNEKDKTAQRELVEFQKGNNLPTLTIYCDFSGLGKDDKKPCNIIYNSPDVNLYGESFTLEGKYSTLQYQGTSSMQYPIKNYRINPADVNGKVKLDPFGTGIPESRFTLKADFMSSGHWQNTGLAKWVNDNLYNYKTNDSSTMNARKWYDIQNGGSVNDTRESIAGFPCRLILVNDGETTLNEGQQEPTPGNTKDMGIFNFNNDKDNVATMGFDTDIFPNALSYEVTANSDTSAGAFVPYSTEGTEWTFADTGTVSIYETTGGYSSSYIPISALSSCPVITPSLEGTWRFYNEAYIELRSQSVGANATYDFTTILSENPSAKYIRYAKYAKDSMKTYTVNDITFIPISTTGTGTEAEKLKEPLYIERGNDPERELEYLQNSFELRFPDADDYGDDHGYLGLPVNTPHIEVEQNGDQCNAISFEYFGTRTLTVSTGNGRICHATRFDADMHRVDTTYNIQSGSTVTFADDEYYVRFYGDGLVPGVETFTINGVEYILDHVLTKTIFKDPHMESALSNEYGLKRVIDWVGNATDEQFLAEFDQYFHRDYTLRYYLLVIVLGMVDNLGKNMMFDTFDGKIWLPRFYDMDTICSYNNSGEITFDVDIEMEQGYWNTSSSRLWTKIRDLMHDELVLKYNDMRQNGMSYESFMSYFYDKQIAQIPQTYYNKDYDVKYAPYADEYMGKAHGDGYEHLKRWLKRRLIFTDTLYDYAPSYTNDALTIRANTLDLMSLEIETYTPVYQHVSFYNGNMEKIKIDGKTSTVFEGAAQTATDQEVLIYGGSNIKSIKGIQSMNPNSMLIGNATRITELDLSNCPILSVVNSNKANFAPHSYLNKLDISNCPELSGTLNVSNSPLLQEVNALGTQVNNILFPSSIRNLTTLRIPKTITSLTLMDAGLLYTLELEEETELQSISMTNCNNLTETINFDLTKTPSVFLDNSYDAEEIYMSDTTNLTLRNMPSLQRVIFTPNSEYLEFDINNVINGANYKITTFNNPMMTDFITTAPHRLSYDNVEYKNINVTPNLLDGHSLRTGRWLRPTTGLDDSSGTINAMLEYIEVEENTEYTLESLKEVASTICFYDSSQTFISALDKASNKIPKTFTTPSGTSYIRFDVTNTITSVGQLHLYKTSDLEYIQVKDYGDIAPNTAFTANTLDLADTQFQNVKFLCTTDIYNLKVPTTMKNFYADSAFDIDTDVIEDASYEVIHEELIEPYTTNYEGNVEIKDVRQQTMTINEWAYPGWTFGADGIPYEYSSYNLTDFIMVQGNQTITFSDRDVDHNLYIAQYDKNKTCIQHSQLNNTGTVSLDIISDTYYIRITTNRGMTSYKITGILEGLVTPNIIPSSASGSLIFNMYSNNTTQPISTSPYMWDLTGLKLNDFYTYGMNNWVKPSEDSYIYVNNVPMFKSHIYLRGGIIAEYTVNSNYTTASPILFPPDIHHFTVMTDTNTSYIDNWATVWDLSNNTVTQTRYTGGTHQTNVSRRDVWGENGTEYSRVRIFSFNAKDLDWFDIKFEGDTTYTVRYYLDVMEEVTPPSDKLTYFSPLSYTKALDEIQSFTMPQRMSGYSVRLVNADITPDEYPTMLYPLLVDTTLPITGKLDYTKYNGTSLAWAYAYTTGDVTIDPVNSQHQGNITQDYNKLYGTDFVDIVDVWVYEDTDISKLSTNEAITKAYIELTSDNCTTRIDEVLAYYPNCTDVYIFDDGSITTLRGWYEGKAIPFENLTFIEGYFNNLTILWSAFRNSTGNLKTVNNLPNSINNMQQTFQGCRSLTYVSNIPTSMTGLSQTFLECTALTQAPVIPEGVTSMNSCFKGCTSLTTPPTIPEGVTNLYECFANCTSLTTPAVAPEGVTNMSSCYSDCTSLTSLPNIPSTCVNIDYICNRCGSKLTGNVVIPNSVTSANWAFRRTGINSISIPLGSLTNAGYIIDQCSDVNITWTGERSSDFIISDMLGSCEPTQADIQELVPEHLADLTGSGTTATLTLGETYLGYLTEEEISEATTKGWTLQ